jgi:hypothetical protein
MIDPRKVEIANRVLACFQPSAQFVVEGNRLMMSINRTWMKSPNVKTVPVLLRKDHHWFTGALGKIYPGGGGSTQAATTLACWLRDWPRLPLASWEYWAKPNGPGLLMDNPEAVGWLRDAGYDDERTRCINCGSIEFKGGLDWWSCDGVSGPCCMWGDCAKAGGAQ